MGISFYKYHGAGNDFVMIDNRELFFEKANNTLIEKICDRKFGIGADGLILLENEENSDFKMIYYNADGNESTMCGNGGRCIVAFAKRLGIINDVTTFTAIDGIHNAEIDEQFNVNLQMQDVENIEEIKDDYILDTGSPHYVKIIDNFPKNFKDQAKKIRNSEKFIIEGINVNFIKVKNNSIEIRTYERGVENETLACGTGCVASALVLMYIDASIKEVSLKAKGGYLKVKANKSKMGYQNIWLYGPTELVFKGSIRI